MLNSNLISSLKTISLVLFNGYELWGDKVNNKYILTVTMNSLSLCKPLRLQFLLSPSIDIIFLVSFLWLLEALLFSFFVIIRVTIIDVTVVNIRIISIRVIAIFTTLLLLSLNILDICVILLLPLLLFLCYHYYYRYYIFIFLKRRRKI